jgi:hypothetical protein
MSAAGQGEGAGHHRGLTPKVGSLTGILNRYTHHAGEHDTVPRGSIADRRRLQLSRRDFRKSTMLGRENLEKEFGPSSWRGSWVTVK